MIVNRVQVPPIKSQGIKTKLVPLIGALLPESQKGTWLEPFAGTAVVGLNLARGPAILADTNPHIIGFYQLMVSGQISPALVREFLEYEGLKLATIGEDHFYEVRRRFNQHHDPLDFLFLNRSCFNGMIRFNRSGGFNVPFCRKPNRFAQSYVTKIVNQVDRVSQILATHDFRFAISSFMETIEHAQPGDIIYCDPPYMGRHADYYNSWTESNEIQLHEALKATPASFILSTWSHNAYRNNPYLASVWADFPQITRDHFYHVGASLKNRGGITEALIYSDDLKPRPLSDEGHSR